MKRTRNIGVADIRAGGRVASGLEELTEQADLVIIGEGRIDEQTLRGRYCSARSILRHGSIRRSWRFSDPSGRGSNFLILNSGADAIFSIVSGTCSIEQTLKRAAENVRISARNVVAALKVSAVLAERRKSGALRKRVPGAAQSA